ncbi:serine hydrolase domain-containing protein [Streptomyces caatingaensis]|uniref:Peptidase n=1 Tax=Streptomyces caatingaensis TaxID=1678637 RepID=A0A0K9XLG8_9ACTN|nr:serine hydrolase domain-containing protein [Streptomyces caatingaensis]KNB53951.1 peptidase [Streptomyces caatingaensis]
MRKLSRRIRGKALGLTAALAVGAVALAGPATAEPVAEKGSHRQTQAALDGLVAAGMPGVAAQTSSPDGQWFGSAGYADTAKKTKRTAQDHIRAGSITKTFVTTVLLQLEAEGKIGLDDSVERWLPGLLKGNGYDGTKVTIRQLLNHTSGIHDMVETPEWNAYMNGPGFLKHRFEYRSPEQIVAMGLKYPPYWAPGTKWHYSNTNFVIAGMVIEKVTGNAWAREAEKRIVKPLGLRGTTFPGTDPTMPAPHAVGYSKLYAADPGPEIYDATEYNPAWSGATGEMISTTGDLNRFFGALITGKLFPKKQLDEMLTTVPAEDGTNNDVPFDYGLGLIVRSLPCGVKVYGHDGIVWGSLTSSAVTRDGKHALTFQINGDWLESTKPYNDVFRGEFCPKPAA